MDRVALEAFLYSADFGEDNYLLASSSSSESDQECCCLESDDVKSLKMKIKKIPGFAELSVPKLVNADFKSHFRVSRQTCEKVTEIIAEEFSSTHKGGWGRISPKKAAYVLLSYLGNRETFKQISDRFKITMSCIHNIVKLGTKNLASKLHQYIAWPASEECESLSQSFLKFSRLKGAIGTIGISHIKILRPKEDPEHYLCNKSYYSIAIQGIVTMNRKFIDLHICEGGKDPIDILNESSIYSKAKNGLLENYFLIGNNSYGSLPWLITPFSSKENQTEEHQFFNQSHKTAWNLFPEVLAHLKGRFERLQHMENKDLPFIIQCIEAMCVIHNICIDCNDDCIFYVNDDGIAENECVQDFDDNQKKIEVFHQCLQICDSNKS